VATQRDSAQDLGTHIGTVVRINPDGSAPADNPFAGREGAKAEIWSYGHRNIQGAALHPPPASCGRTSTDRAAATRSTSRGPAATTAGR
jgi:hypothetical protein